MHIDKINPNYANRDNCYMFQYNINMHYKIFLKWEQSLLISLCVSYRSQHSWVRIHMYPLPHSLCLFWLHTNHRFASLISDHLHHHLLHSLSMEKGCNKRVSGVSQECSYGCVCPAPRRNPLCPSAECYQ